MRQRFSVTSNDISCFVSKIQGTCVTLSPKGVLSDQQSQHVQFNLFVMRYHIVTKKTVRSTPFSDQILKMITLRNYKRRQWQRSKQQDIKNEVNFLNRQIKAQVKIFNNEIRNAKLSQLKKHSNQFWRVTKMLKNPIIKIPPLK